MIQHQPDISNDGLIDLYTSVGWSVYADRTQMMSRLLESSLWWAADVVDGQVRGLVRVVGDDVSIAYIQDILVRPEFQRQGLGRDLITQAMQRFAHVRQIVLVTDNNESLKIFTPRLGSPRSPMNSACALFDSVRQRTITTAEGS